MPSLRQRTLGAVLALLFISIAFPGCMSLVLGREMLEGARGEPQVQSVSKSYDASHIFENATDPNGFQVTESELIPIDETVQEIIIIFQVQFHYDDIDDTVPNVGNLLEMMDQRYVEVSLRPCDASGSNCGDPVYYEHVNKSYDRNRTEISAVQIAGLTGTWRLEAEGQGVGINTGTPIDFSDSWTLRVSVIRPCLTFPESPEVCTPTIEFD